MGKVIDEELMRNGTNYDLIRLFEIEDQQRITP